jgi:hypothetical protein
VRQAGSDADRGLRDCRPSVGKKLIELPEYTFRVLVSSLSAPPEEIWRDYNHRADMENRIAELQHDLGADLFCLQYFHASDAVFRSVLLPFKPDIASRLLAMFAKPATAMAWLAQAMLLDGQYQEFNGKLVPADPLGSSPTRSSPLPAPSKPYPTS